MNKSTVAKMIADACKDAVRDAMRFVNTETPVAAPVAAPAPVAGDVHARRLAGLEKARAAKKAIAQARVATPAVAAPMAAPVAVVAKPVVSAAKPAKAPAKAWEVKDHTTKKGAKGKIVTVGPFSAWIPEGDKARKSAVVAAINLIRTDVSYEIATAIG